MKFEHTTVMNFEGALRGMRNPMQSWYKADSKFPGKRMRDPATDVTTDVMEFGENDLQLAQRLIKAGTDDRKFMRQIFVCVDITAPLYWWKEFDTYKVGTVANSESTMHKLASTEITKDCFESSENELLDIGDYIELNDEVIGEHINRFRKLLEKLRIEYNETKNKNCWKLLVKLLHSSWLQKRTVTMNYENLFSIAHSDRKTHKLTEWSKDFFAWMHTLPYAEELIFIDTTPQYIKDREAELIRMAERLEDMADLVSKDLSDKVFLSECLLNVAETIRGKKDENKD